MQTALAVWLPPGLAGLIGSADVVRSQRSVSDADFFGWLGLVRRAGTQRVCVGGWGGGNKLYFTRVVGRGGGGRSGRGESRRPRTGSGEVMRIRDAERERERERESAQRQEERKITGYNERSAS